MNLSKAFDCLPHRLLLCKLRYYGITDNAYTLSMSYLSQRKQRVKIGRSRSYWGNLLHGVPQGSILGSQIFYIFLNDVFYVLDKQCNLYNYVDDNTLVNSDACILSLKSKLEKSANMASHWFANNHMKSNFSKFQTMILNNHPDSCEISLRVANTDVKLNDCVKLLGVYIDYELKLKNHVDHLCKRTSRQLSAIRRITEYCGKQRLHNVMCFCEFKVWYMILPSSYICCTHHCWVQSLVYVLPSQYLCCTHHCEFKVWYMFSRHHLTAALIIVSSKSGICYAVIISLLHSSWVQSLVCVCFFSRHHLTAALIIALHGVVLYCNWTILVAVARFQTV